LTGLALVVAFGSGAFAPQLRADSIATFENLPLEPESSWNGPDPNGQIVPGTYGDVNVGSFTSGGAVFTNRYDLTYGSWSGFAYSNTTDTTTPGWTNQFSAYTGSGYNSANYGVAFGYRDLDRFDPTNVSQLKGLPSIAVPTGEGIAGMFVTNTTYAALSMLYGDGFGKKFGGETGDDEDWFKLTAYGIDASGNAMGTSVDFYLADYRFEDNSKDYIVSDWQYWDLSALSGAASLHFNLSSSDVGQYGMNTPAYFALDDVRFTTSAIPEPSSFVLMGIGGISLAFLGPRARRAA
jgi:hypothetical protein